MNDNTPGRERIPLEPPQAESIYADFRARQEGGESVDFDDLLRRHADHAQPLRLLHADFLQYGVPLAIAAPAAERGAVLDDDGRVSMHQESSAAEVEDANAPPMPREADELLARLASARWSSKRYRFRSVLGRGGQGVVLKVWDQNLNRPLAMKLAMGRGEREIGAATPRVEPSTLARFLDEAQISGQLDHPGIVPLHEMGLDSTGRAYFTMRLVRGDSFDRIIEKVHRGEDEWTRARALNVLLRVCEALSYAHARRVIHRDLKPTNIIVGPYGEVFVMDWGLARVLGQRDRAWESLKAQADQERSVRSLREGIRTDVEGSPFLTAAGAFLGTPEYASPEQAAGRVEALPSVSTWLRQHSTSSLV